MARMSVDDMIARDPRITILAGMLGWSRREALGCLVGEVWPICYDQRTWLVSKRVIDAAANHPGFADALIECELATLDRSGKVHIRGAKERIKYLDNKSIAGREGGLKSAESRRRAPKQTASNEGSTPQAARNPNTNTPVPASAPASPPVQEKNASPPARAPSSEHVPALRAFDAYFKAKNDGASPGWDDVSVGMLKTLVKKRTCDEVVRRIEILNTAPPAFPPQPWDLKTLVAHFDKCASPTTRNSAAPVRHIEEL